MTELFQYETCTDAVLAAKDYLLKQLNESEGHILLLLSGGSCLNPVREAFKELDDETLGRIDIAQIDGRYVDIGAEGSNWRQIKEALGKKLDKTDTQLAFLNTGDEPEDIAITYEMELTALLENADEVIGFYGIGTDGHIAGMLPTKDPEEFTRFLDGRLVVDYEAPDYVRLTTTLELITRLDEAVVFACGPEKVRAVAKLDENLPPHKHPAQLLKDAKRATIFIGEEEN
jgi:6-phosphogluconolactonase/glucosamine-6-phosphate isomerase/deaminase